jgi:hypothetical protein
MNELTEYILDKIQDVRVAIVLYVFDKLANCATLLGAVAIAATIMTGAA